MKLEITRRVEQKEIIDIEFPYYYKHDLMLDEVSVVIYGKVEENKLTTIKKSEYYQEGIEYEFSVKRYPATYSAEFMSNKYAISRREYLHEADRMYSFIDKEFPVPDND